VVQLFMRAFWGTPKTYSGDKQALVPKLLVPTIVLVALSVLYGVGAEAMRPLIQQAVEPLTNPTLYIDAVLKGGR
ncbi:MAG: Na+/H+ antiporter subunit D, partial [Exiguobacterium acetylicum]